MRAGIIKQRMKDPFLTLALPRLVGSGFFLEKIKVGIETTLEDRAKTHGDFSGHAMISQALKDVLRSGKSWPELTDAQKEALDMSCHKMARIVNGNPHHKDHWHDLVGYAKLVDDLFDDDKQDGKL